MRVIKYLQLLTITLFIISCKKEYSVENQPVQKQPQPPTSIVTDITGIWIGKMRLRPNFTMNYCWKITKDSIFTYDDETMPQTFTTLKGKWSLKGNIFKAGPLFNINGEIYTDSAILSNDYKKMIGIEIYRTGNSNFGTFVMNKK